MGSQYIWQLPIFPTKTQCWEKFFQQKPNVGKNRPSFRMATE
jgi:hypothetical protein